MSSKTLIFDSEKFNFPSLLQKVTCLTNNPLTELHHAQTIESFGKMVIHNGPYEIIIVNFQMLDFLDFTGGELEQFVVSVRKCQRNPFIFFGVTGWENQVSTLRRLGLAITHKEYNGIQVDVSDSSITGVPKCVTKEGITRLVCEYYQILYKKVFTKSRKREIVKARQTSIYLSKQFTKDSLKIIGEFFGGRDHTTVIHSCQAVQEHMDSEPQYRGDVAILQGMVEKLKI